MDVFRDVRTRLQKAAEANRGEAVLLSGGLDSSIVAFLARPDVAFTASLKGAAAADPGYSEELAGLLGIPLEKVEFSVEDALDALPDVVGILKTFDLALPNDVCVYLALRAARERGVRSIMTGDGADELFAGYSYMAELSHDQLTAYGRALSASWSFSSRRLGGALGITVRQPFLDEDFVRFALEIEPALKIRDGVGKYVLRKSVDGLLPADIVWRRKEPIEYGSGSTRLHQIIADMVSDAEFVAAVRDVDIKFLNKEHFFYYRIYRAVVGEIPRPRAAERSCPCCGAGLTGYHCKVCGYSTPLRDQLRTSL